MTDAFSSFFNKAQPFGLNVKVPGRTFEQIGKTVGDTASGVLEPLFTYLEENENVFTGDVTKEFNKISAENFNTTMMLRAADEQVNGQVRKRLDATF